MDSVTTNFPIWPPCLWRRIIIQPPNSLSDFSALGREALAGIDGAAVLAAMGRI
ncbi:MAG: hypothetical protein ABIM50_02400 [Novosphingobium sp.]